MKKTFYSNGKLLITGEYLVLDGAKAFALPTKFGQFLEINIGNKKSTIFWKSIDADGSTWFESEILFSSIINKELFENDSVKTTLIEILHEAYKLNTSFLEEINGYEIETRLTFPKLWGLGTSSTLINNIANWLSIDPYALLKTTFGGSGYDIACAQNNFPILYQIINEKPVISKVIFEPSFKEAIYFIYLNKKQSSKTAIASYLRNRGNIQKSISIIDLLTTCIISSKEPKEFAKALAQHEIEMSNVLENETIQKSLFKDFNGVIKSLGAWGGDFIMSISKEDPTAYFKDKGYDVIIPYKEMIL